VIIIIFLIRSLLCKILTTEKESYFRNQKLVKEIFYVNEWQDVCEWNTNNVIPPVIPDDCVGLQT